jgi:hypothetical protein
MTVPYSLVFDWPQVLPQYLLLFQVILFLSLVDARYFLAITSKRRRKRDINFGKNMTGIGPS